MERRIAGNNLWRHCRLPPNATRQAAQKKARLSPGGLSMRAILSATVQAAWPA